MSRAAVRARPDPVRTADELFAKINAGETLCCEFRARKRPRYWLEPSSADVFAPAARRVLNSPALTQQSDRLFIGTASQTIRRVTHDA